MQTAAKAATSAGRRQRRLPTTIIQAEEFRRRSRRRPSHSPQGGTSWAAPRPAPARPRPSCCRSTPRILPLAQQAAPARHPRSSADPPDARTGAAGGAVESRPPQQHSGPTIRAMCAFGGVTSNRRSPNSEKVSTSFVATPGGCSTTTARPRNSDAEMVVSKPTACSTWVSFPDVAHLLEHAAAANASSLLFSGDLPSIRLADNPQVPGASKSPAGDQGPSVTITHRVFCRSAERPSAGC